MSTLTLGMAAGGVPAAAAPDLLAAQALRIATRTALGVLGDRTAAEDVAQEVAIITLRRHGTVRDRAALEAWIHRVAVRAALREAKRSASRRTAERAAARHERITDDGDAAIAAASLLTPLPPRQRAALTLRYVHDLDDAAIAAALGCRPGTVRSLLSRGLASLRGSASDPQEDQT